MLTPVAIVSLKPRPAEYPPIAASAAAIERDFQADLFTCSLLQEWTGCAFLSMSHRNRPVRVIDSRRTTL